MQAERRRVSGYRRQKLKLGRTEQTVKELLDELEQVRPLVSYVLARAKTDPGVRRLVAEAFRSNHVG